MKFVTLLLVALSFNAFAVEANFSCDLADHIYSEIDASEAAYDRCIEGTLSDEEMKLFIKKSKEIKEVGFKPLVKTPYGSSRSTQL